MKEKRLISAIAQGDKIAFNQFYQLYAEKIYNIALSYTKKTVDAEEITQDVFVKIFQKAKNFKGKSTVNTWVYKITINSALNFLKKKKRIQFFRLGPQEKEKPDFQHPGVILENKESAKILFQFIDQLPDKQKTVFILSYIEGLPRAEVARIMTLSLKAVESLLQRGKQKLRKQLKKAYPNRRKS